MGKDSGRQQAISSEALGGLKSYMQIFDGEWVGALIRTLLKDQLC